jgi:hypothetical protein
MRGQMEPSAGAHDWSATGLSPTACYARTTFALMVQDLVSKPGILRIARGASGETGLW